jgi:hypothetical protein
MDDGDLAMQMMRATGRKVVTVVSLVAILSGCANMTDQEKYAIMIGTLGGNTALGAGVGTGAGMLGGYIYSLHH